MEQAALKNNQARELLPRPDLYGAGYIRPLPSSFYIVMVVAAVKSANLPKRRYRKRSSGKF
jgi:hypothetical protein